MTTTLDRELVATLACAGRPHAAGVDLSDPDLFVAGEHQAAFARLRDEAPVHWNPTEDGGFWAVTRYEDVVSAYRDPLLSSAHGAILGGSFNSERDTASGRMLVCADPPQHRQLRQLMMPLFSAAWVKRVEAQVTGLVDRALDDLAAAGGGDVATDLAPALPLGALMTFFDLSLDGARELLGLTHAMIGYLDPEHRQGIDAPELRLVEAQAAIFDFFDDLIDLRRSQPGDDAVSYLISATLNNRPLARDVILFNLMNLAVGGNETTPHTASHGVAQLVGPAASDWDRLRGDPTLAAGAVEEMLRWGSTNAYVQRVALEPTAIAGVAVAAGDSVTLWNASANRDERQFPEPDRFDITRSPNRHISFGSGIHHCIGSMTARAELTAFARALARTPIRLTAAGEPALLRSNFMLGLTRLPVSASVEGTGR